VQAFALFTSGIGSWWPLAAHSIAADTLGGAVTATGLVFEEGQGGRLYEVMSDGTEGEWGRVLEWDPPRHVAFSWKPNLYHGPYTRIDVTFEPLSDGTRVELVHSGWDQFGAEAAKRRNGYVSGWANLLDRYASSA
jgi:uncharacterized protein YndB with AHSA1/START domain